MKTLIIYSSCYGSSERYATAIAESLKGEIKPVKKVKTKDIEAADVIIYGGGIYGGKIREIEVLKKYKRKLKEKTVLIFSVGIADAENKKVQERIRQSTKKFIGEALAKEVYFYHFRGALKMEELGFVHKRMLKFVKKQIEKKDPGQLTAADRQMLNNFESDKDYVDTNTIKPLVDFVQGKN